MLSSNSKVNRLVCIVALLLFQTSANAQTDAVDQFVLAQMQTQNIPGLSLAVIKDGKVIKASGYGLADVKQKRPATPETVYRVASASKQFIASGIMLLVQEGRLRIDDPITNYLDDPPETWKAITIRQLMAHTAGLVREPPGFDPFKPQPDAVVIKSAYALPLRFAPGQKYEYSNVGYFILGEIIRAASGKPWTEYIAEKIFKPAGMHSTYPTNTTVEIPNRAAGYTDNQRLEQVRDWTALRPSGAFLSTVLDMAKWDSVLYTNDVLSEATKAEMWTPVLLSNGATYPYGFGWQIGSYRGRKFVHHGGGGPGIRTEFARFIDDRLTIVLLMNMDDVDIDTLLYGIAAIYLPAAPS